MPSADDGATLQAFTEGVEHARAEAEREWGFGRLPLLVDDEMRGRFNRQKTKWSRAIQAAWDAPILTRDLLAEVETQAGGMKRAWGALSAAATEAGHRPVAPWVWEIPLADGSIAAFVQSDAEASKVIAEGRAISVWTPREIANVIAAIPEALQLAKVAWPGAQVPPPKAINWRVGDEIPF